MVTRGGGELEGGGGDRRITGACLATSRKFELCEMASRRPHPGAQHLGAAPSSSPKKNSTGELSHRRLCRILAIMLSCKPYVTLF